MLHHPSRKGVHLFELNETIFSEIQYISLLNPTLPEENSKFPIFQKSYFALVY